jgi:transposase
MHHHGHMKAYSEDLRRKVVEAVQQRGMSKSEAARTFGVSLSSVKRYVGKARRGSPLSPKKHPGPRSKMSERARRLLKADVENRPAVTLRERRRFVEGVAGCP